MLPCRSVVARIRIVTSRASAASEPSKKINQSLLFIGEPAASSKLHHCSDELFQMAPQRPRVRACILALQLLPVVAYIDQLSREVIRSFRSQEQRELNLFV